jgi:iron complex outermembrane receptor protein
MEKFMRHLLISLAVLAFSQGVKAELLLETLVVTGQVTAPATLAQESRVSRPEERLPGIRIDSAELLQGLPGVQSDSRSNYAQDTRVTLRGFGARSAFGVRGLDLLVDGIPQTTPDGQGQLSSIALDAIDQVEVLRGPLAGLYGNGAGGVIALQTSAPEYSSLGLRSLYGESHTSRQALVGQWREGALGLKFQGSRFVTDGDRPHAEAERNHAGFQGYYLGEGGLEARLRLDYSHDPLLQDPLGLTPDEWRENPNKFNELAEIFNVKKEVDHRQISLSLRQAQGDGRWQIAAWSGQREIRQYLGFSGDAISNSGGVVDLQRDFYGTSGSYTRDLHLGAGKLTASIGAELSRSEDRRKGYVNNRGEQGDLRRDELGEVKGRDIYTLLQWLPDSPWAFYVGARHSHLDFWVDDYFVVPGNPDDSGGRDYSHWSSALGASYRLPGDWRTSFSLGRGFETPTLAEMAYRRQGTGLNTQLEAALNRQQQWVLSHIPAKGPSYSLTLFNIDSTDELVVDQSVGGRTSYRNAAATERRGVEISGEAELAENWQLWLSLNYLEAEYSAGEWEGNLLPGVARHNHYAQLRWQPLADERLILGLGVQERSRVATADDNLQLAPSATLVDLALSSRQTLGSWQLYVWTRLANATDRTYVGSVIVNQSNGRAFEPAPGRSLSAGLDLNYLW